MMNRGFRN